MVVVNPLLTGSDDYSLSELLRLTKTKPGGEAVGQKIVAGREELSRLGSAVSTLRNALQKLSEPALSSETAISDIPAAARSLKLGLSYDADNPGNNDPSKMLSSLDLYGPVRSGILKINNRSVSIDPNNDSLDSIIARINSSGTGVTARLDPKTDRLELVANHPRSNIVIDEGDTDFFSASNLAPRTYYPKKEISTVLGDKNELIGVINDMGKALEEIFKGSYQQLDAGLLDKLAAGLSQAIAKATGMTSTTTPRTLVRSGIGIDFDFTFSSSRFFNFSASTFNRKVEENLPEVYKFLAGSTGDEPTRGFAKILLDQFDKTLNNTVTSIGAKFADGLLVDLKA